MGPRGSFSIEKRDRHAPGSPHRGGGEGAGGVSARRVPLPQQPRSLPAASLELAEADLETRHDTGAFDTLAWALYRNGRYDEAREASDRALEMGTSDAVAFYHAGVIFLALGERDRGITEIERALEMNPFFNALLAKEARSIVDGIES